MTYEVIIEEFVLRCDVTRCLDIPPCPGIWSSDWDAQGTQDLEFEVVGVKTYDEDGMPLALEPEQCAERLAELDAAIEAELWRQINADAREADLDYALDRYAA